ncbi:MAG: vWA domain-containing protein [archaeon]
MNRKILNLLLISLALAVVLFSCQQSPPPELSKQSDELAEPTKEVAKEAKPVQKEAAKPKPRVWPYIAEGQKDYALAENLIAKNFILVFDGSGSMNDSNCSGSKSKIDVAKEAVIEWSQTIPPDSNLGLVAFHRGGDNGWTVLQLTPKSQSKNFVAAVKSIEADNNTPLATAFKLAYGILTKQAQNQLGYGEYTIVAVTDGEDNDRHESLKDWIRRILNNSPIRIYTIGFCIKGGHSLNQPNRMTYREANDPAELRKGLKEVLAEAESFDITEFSKK